ncbi:MAG: ABC transporter permease [Deltaproteobacteria bacterium]|nr:ABC transporter permease [Deltaproteobacteria bacterium]
MRNSILERCFNALLTNGAFLALVMYLIIFIIYGISQGSYAVSVYGITVLFNNSIVIAIAAVAETFIILMGGFDLSVAGIVVLTNTLIAVQQGAGVGGALLCLIIAIGVGGVIGCINGFLVSRIGLQSIAATLGTSILCSGIALLVLAQPGGYVPDEIAYTLTDSIGPIPVAAIIALLIGLISWILLRKTNFGAGIYALGRDRTAAELSGIATRSVEFRAYVMAGIFSGLAGFMLSAQTGTGDPHLSNSFILLTFAAVAIGGVSFDGGHGSVIGSIIGAGILALLQKTLFSVGVSSFYTGIFQGSIMLLAMLVGSLSLIISKRRAVS